MTNNMIFGIFWMCQGSTFLIGNMILSDRSLYTMIWNMSIEVNWPFSMAFNSHIKLQNDNFVLTGYSWFVGYLWPCFLLSMSCYWLLAMMVSTMNLDVCININHHKWYMYTSCRYMYPVVFNITSSNRQIFYEWTMFIMFRPKSKGKYSV